MMALQHYNGRKHQRNKAREKLMQGLGEDAQQGTAQSICLSITFWGERTLVFNSLLVDESRSVASSIPQKLKPFVFVWLLLSAARGFICQVCNARFTSMEMYQAHMKGNKHQVK